MNNYALLNYNATEIQWDGPSIPCIGICHKDMVSDIVYKVAKRVCEIVNDIDSLATLDLSCLLEYCENCDEDKSLKHIVQLLFNNDCSLKELIDDLVDLANDKAKLVLDLDLTCLTTCSSYSTIVPDQFNCSSSIIILEECAYTPYTSCPCPEQDFINECGETTEYTLNDLLQYLIDRVCCHSDIISQMETRIDDLEEAYTTIASTLPDFYQEPVLTTCVNPIGRIHSLVTGIIANYICSLRYDLGSTSEVNVALSKACITDYVFNFEGNEDGVLIGPNQIVVVAHGFSVGQEVTYFNNGNPNVGGMVDGTTYYVKTVVDPDTITLSAFSTLIPTLDITAISTGTHTLTLLGIIPNSENLAQNSFNQWSVLCDVWSRLTTIKTGSCCLPDCGDIKIGFQYVYIEDENIYQLIFNSDYGTKIPTGWVDCGSKITVEDWKGIYFTFDIEIVNSFTFDLELTGLDLSHPISVNIKTCFTHEETSINCKECLGYTFPAIPSSCDYCKICAGATNPTDQIKVSYYTADNLNVRYSILSPGICLSFKMPEESPTITSTIVLTTGSDIDIAVDPSSQCFDDLTIPVPKANTCWFFPIPMSDSFHVSLDDWTLLFSPLGMLNFDFRALATNNFTYSSISTEVDANLPLTGSTLGCTVLNSGLLGGAPDTAIIFPNVPSYAIGGGIISSKACETLTAEHNGDLLTSGRIQIGIAGTNADKKITFGYTPSAGTMGIVLELQSQTPTVIPLLTLEDPITGTKMIIKGQYQEDSCDCA
jgi:hypothetical protein